MRLRSSHLRHGGTLVVLLAALLLGGRAALAADAAVEKDITYGKAGDRELKLDLARPGEGEGPFPGIVFIHGGGWRGGNRARYAGAIREAARRGYVAVTVTYRLTEADDEGKAANPFPAAVHDVKAAVRWLRANAKEYNVDPDRIGVTGGSAGGHLSLMLGLTNESAGLEGEGGHPDVSSRVQAVVNFYGPTDMTLLAKTSKGAAPIVASFLDGSAKDVPEVYKKASPITYASEDDPPVLSLHGAEDRLVPPGQAEALDKKLNKAGGSHTLKFLEGQGHGFRAEARKRANEAMFAFFDEHLK